MEIEAKDDSKSFSEKALKDFELIEKAKSGDEKAYAELLNRYKKSVYFTILKMVRNVDDAEDLTIEAFTKAFKNLDKFNPSYTFSTWLFRVATNNCIDFMRKKKNDTLNSSTSLSSRAQGDTPNEPDIDVKDSALNPQEAVMKDQKNEFIRSMVDKLPGRYKQLVRLRYFEEKSYQEISGELSIPLGTVKTQLFRARELLFDLVKDTGDSIWYSWIGIQEKCLTMIEKNTN